MAPVIEFVLFSTYVTNNRRPQEDLGQRPDGLEPWLFVLLLAWAVGLVSGGVRGTAISIATTIPRRLKASCPIER